MRVARQVELNRNDEKLSRDVASCPPGWWSVSALCCPADGLRDKEIAQELGITPEKAAR
jgi:hypothetical protein